MHNTAEMGFFKIALSRSVMLRAARIAGVVGIILAVINHGDRLIHGPLDGVTVLKIAMTFLVPFCVSTYSSVLAVRERLQLLNQ